MKQCCFLLLSIVLFSISTWAQADWQLIKNKDGIKVFKKNDDSSAFKTIRVETTLSGTWEELVKILKDVSHHDDWVYKSKDAKLVKNVNENELIYYTVTEIPWPLENRDVVIDMKFIRDKLGKLHQVSTSSVEGYIPEKSSTVRVPSLKAQWQVRVPEPGKLAITYTISLNPGGSLPAWLVNTFAARGPFETFRKLAAKMK